VKYFPLEINIFSTIISFVKNDALRPYNHVKYIMCVCKLPPDNYKLQYVEIEKLDSEF